MDLRFPSSFTSLFNPAAPALRGLNYRTFPIPDASNEK
jgi:hypothetical protein